MVTTSIAAKNTVISINRFKQKLAKFLILIDDSNGADIFETPSISATSAFGKCSAGHLQI